MRKDERNVFPEDTNYKNTDEKEMLKKQKSYQPLEDTQLTRSA